MRCGVVSVFRNRQGALPPLTCCFADFGAHLLDQVGWGVVSVMAADEGFFAAFCVPVFAVAAFPAVYALEARCYQLGNNIANSCCHARIILALCENCKSFLSPCASFCSATKLSEKFFKVRVPFSGVR